MPLTELGAPYGIYAPNGARNKISKYAVLHGSNGILNYAPESEISKSTVFAASAYGISWSTVSTGIISGNVAVGNRTYDLEDVSPDCSGVVWSNNVGQKGKSCIQ